MTRRGALWVAYAIYVAIGFFGAVIGPALDDLGEQVGTSSSVIGMLLTAIFLGAFIAQASVGPLMDRFGPRPLLLAGLALATLGVFGLLGSPGLEVILVAGVIFGMGIGSLDTGSNVLVAGLYNDQSVSVLNSLHLFIGVGSVIAPAVAGQALERSDSAMPAIWIGAGMLIVLWPGVLRLPTHTNRPDAGVHDAAHNLPGSFSYRSVLLWGLGAVLLLFVGAEMGLSAWMTQYVEATTSLSKVAGARITSVYWLALTGGRLAGIRWGKRFGGDGVMLISLTGTLVGAVALVVGSGIALLTVIGAVVIGFFLGPVYPTVMALATATFRSGPGKAASLVASMASVGGMIGPALQGLLLNEVSPVSSIIFVLVQCAGMLVLYATLRQRRATLVRQVPVVTEP